MDLAGLPYAVRRMRESDIPTVSAIESLVFALPWSTTAFRHEVCHNETSEFLLLRYLPWAHPGGSPFLQPVRRLFRGDTQDPSVLGYGGFWAIVDEAHICTLAVRGEWRGRGLGELLLASLIERAIGRPARLATLEVRVGNTVAQNLYRKYGFEVVGRRKRYYSDNGEDAYIMSSGGVLTNGYQRRFQELTGNLREKLMAIPEPPPDLAGTE